MKKSNNYNITEEDKKIAESYVKLYKEKLSSQFKLCGEYEKLYKELRNGIEDFKKDKPSRFNIFLHKDWKKKIKVLDNKANSIFESYLKECEKYYNLIEFKKL